MLHLPLLLLIGEILFTLLPKFHPQTLGTILPRTGSNLLSKFLSKQVPLLVPLVLLVPVSTVWKNAHQAQLVQKVIINKVKYLSGSMERLDFYGFLCSGFLMCLYPYIGLWHGLYIL